MNALYVVLDLVGSIGVCAFAAIWLVQRAIEGADREEY